MLGSLTAKFESELFESVIPFWERHSVDRQNGGYFTCLERDGTLYDSRKYVWLQGRQLWTFSKLYNDFEKRPEWLEIARLGADFLRANARDPEGRCYFSLTREGAPVFYQRKPYAAVFVCIGYNEYAKASGDLSYRAEAIDLFRRIRGWIANPQTMGRPAMPGALAYSQMADIMVVASIALELEAHDPSPEWRAVMRECLDRAMLHYEPSRGILIENVSPDGKFRFDTPEGRLFCPGHSMEVCWFLMKLLDYHPDPAIEAKVQTVLTNSIEIGWDRDFGGLYYFMDLEGKPTLQLESSMKLWWAHSEGIYALIHAYARNRDQKLLPLIDQLVDYSWTHYSDPSHGEWFGYCERDGRLSHTLKGNNYKGCFHVPRMLMLGLEQMRSPAAP